ncbi:hypothetical protein CDL12_15673 [Handroanthus impetiginosus]|uniref:Remorin C-terminal domain-containing protein n=1 Tax=Handroanthus impetiginosus TaxID=429701 RepID=A0A2G9H2G2_9LAMI|nr:hypothetical protein CDL12_15673 [Handroanthus impetiginosus]
MMRYSYDLDDDNFATAIAASAYAIHALEEANSNKVQFRNADTRKQEPLRPPKPDSIKSPSAKDTRTSSSLSPTLSSSAEGQRRKQTSRGQRTFDANADAWEKAQIAKIRKCSRYEKMQSEIAAWENEKKLREKHQMERKKSELEQRKSRNLKHYQNKIARINRIAGGARAQVEEKCKNDESIVKEKARKMRSTGKAPVVCFCF